MEHNAAPTEADSSHFPPEVQKAVTKWTYSQIIDLNAKKRKLIGREYGVRKRVRKADATYIHDRNDYEAPPEALEFGRNPYPTRPIDAYMGKFIDEEPPVKLERAKSPMIPMHDDDERRMKTIVDHPSYLIALPKEPKEPKKRKSKAKNKPDKDSENSHALTSETAETAVKLKSKAKRKVKGKLEEDDESKQDIKAEIDTDGPTKKCQNKGNSGKVKKEESDRTVCLSQPLPPEPSVSITHLIADVMKMSLFSLPAEVRLTIYRYALVADSPIRVHGNWTLVYPLQHLNLPSKLLQANSLVFKEASAVLYGDNVFKYVLRDISNSIHYGTELATDDTPLFDSEEDEDEIYLDGHLSSSNVTSAAKAESKIRHRLATRKSSKLSDKDINLSRYIGHFRQIVVEAERNRWDKRTEEAMAKALDVFTPSAHRIRLPNCNEKSYVPIRASLHSVTIRVTPSTADFDGPSAPQAFTMVNFFDPDANVMQSIIRLPCRWLYIHLIAPEKLKSNRSKMKSNTKTTGYNLSLDTETLFKTADEPDQWKHDRVIKRQRAKRLANCETWLKNLRDKVQYYCQEGKFATERDNDDDENMPDGMEDWYDDEY